ncbi:MAG: hypothetical protein L6R30_16805 [Thermoanaerobaculia bacterium]|nr:hypothetical protein [Thermoanaerobaculia bacterium]
MPQAYGDDRLLPASAGQVLLFSPEAKEWRPRKPATELSSEHPGTAVIWEDDIWEVLEVDEMPGFGVQYRLAPWDEQHAIRLPLRYCQESEARRQSAKREDNRALLIRLVLWATAPASGLLPGHVQERFSRLYGSPFVALAWISMILPMIWGTISVLALMLAIVNPAAVSGLAPGGAAPLAFGGYLFIETLVRFGVAMTDGRPTGSILGVLPYWIFIKIRGGEIEDPSRTFVPDISHISLSDEDTYSMLEPVLSLLSVKEQEFLEKEFGFLPVKWGRRTSTALLALMLAQLVSSVQDLRQPHGGFSAFLAFFLALVIGSEQLWRLWSLWQGQVCGSLLAPLVRIAARRLLASEHRDSGRGAGG